MTVPFAARDQEVLEADVRERAAHHDLVVAAARAVGVEVLRLDAVRDEVLRRGGVLRDVAGRRDVVGRDGVPEHDEAARAGEVLRGRGRLRDVREEGRLAHVSRGVLPDVRPALRDPEGLPALVAVEDLAVRLLEVRGLHGRRDRLAHLLRRRPDVLEEDGRAAPVRPERLGREVLVHLARERVRDDERRRGEVVHLDLRVDAALEVAVAREDARDDEVARAHGLGDGVRQRARVADARRAAVADEVEADGLEVGHEPGVPQVVRDDLRAGRERRLDPRLHREPALDGLLREEAGAEHDGRVRRVRARRDRRDDDGSLREVVRHAAVARRARS